MRERFIEKLISPDGGLPLRFYPGTGQLREEGGGHEYEVIDGIPVLLPRGAKEARLEAEQHRLVGSEFRYVAHYQRDAEVFDYFQPYEDPATRHENRRLHETIISALPEGCKNILDVGCGNAWVAGHFCPLGKEVYSLDVALQNTRRALEAHPYDNHFALVADVYNLPLKEAQFDCIIAAEIIEHVPDPAAFLQALLEVLKPGGRLVLTTPYDEKIQYSLCIHCNRPTPMNAHLHSFTGEKLVKLLPPAVRTGAKALTFGNKALIKLQTHRLLGRFPYRWWQAIDRLADRLVRKPSRILFCVDKPNSPFA